MLLHEAAPFFEVILTEVAEGLKLLVSCPCGLRSHNSTPEIQTGLNEK